MKRALIVEDDACVSKLLEELVWSMGLVPITSGSVADAVAQLGPDVDLILLDLLLPNGHGYDVLRAIAERRNDLPVIVVSAYPEEKAHEPPTPILEWIQKPFEMPRIREAIERACRLSSSIESIRRSTDRLGRAVGGKAVSP